MAEYAAGRTPNPCLRCNEKIKFAAVLDRALGARLRRRRDRPLRAAAHRRRRADRDAPRGRPRQGPVLRARRARPRSSCAHSLFPLGDSTKADVREEAARRGLPVADKPDSHDICFIADGDTAGWLREKLGDRAPNHGGDDRRRRPARCSAQHEGTYALHDRPAQGAAASARPAPDGKPRYVLDIEPVSGTVTVGPRDGLAVDRLDRRSGRAGAAPCPRRPRGHRPAARPRRRAPRRGRRVDGDEVDGRAARPGRGHRPRPGGRGLRRHPGRRVGHDLAPTRRADVGSRPAMTRLAPPASGRCPASDEHAYAEAVRRRARRAARPAAPARAARAAGAIATMTGRALAVDRRARRRPAAGRLAADRRARASTTGGRAACWPRTSTRSRSRPRATSGAVQGPGRRPVDAGRDGREAARRQGAQPTSAPAASWPRRWPRGCATTSRDVRRRRARARPAGRPGRRARAGRGAGRRRCRRPPGSAGTAPSTRPRPRQALEWVLDAIADAGAEPWVHSCAAGTPLDLLRGAGARGLRSTWRCCPPPTTTNSPRRSRQGETVVARRACRPPTRRTPPTDARGHRARAALARHARPRPGDGRRPAGADPRLRAGRRHAGVGAPGPRPRCGAAATNLD